MFLHLDLDCFFVSAHRTLDKKLLGIPVAVGGRSNLNIFDKEKAQRTISLNSGAFVSSILSSNENKSFEEYFVDENKRIRGIITTSSYEARAYGVKTAMSVSEAKTLCPHLKVLPPNYPLYHDLSHKLKKILEKEIPEVEQFSIDEFFGDIRGYIAEDEVVAFANYIKELIQRELDLPISIGIAKTKWIAKLATEYAKPNDSSIGIKVIYPNEVEDFIKDIPIEEFPGIGKGYCKRLKSYGINFLGDIKKKRELFYSWKKPGIQLYNRVCGIDNEKISIKKEKKSIGIGRTFDANFDRNEVKRRLIILCRHLCFLIKKQEISPMTYHLKIKYEYRVKSKNYINLNRKFSELLLKEQMLKLFELCDIHPKHGIIQINLMVSNFNSEKNSFNLFEYEKDVKKSELTDSMQKLRNKFGIDIIKTANEL